MTRWTRPWDLSAWLGTVTVSVVFMAVPADAQRPRNWEFEFHAGGSFVSDAPAGTASLPAAGSTFTTVVGTPSRRISSWYFGDGALLFNQANASLGLGSRITPLDPLFESSLSDPQSGASFGFRLGRAITRRFGAEFTLDYGRVPLVLRPSALTSVEGARASYVAAFTALMGSGPFVNPAVTSVSTIAENEGSQITTTGALIVNLKTSGRAIPYVTAGAGVRANAGGTPSMALEGHYRFQPLGLFPVDELDSVTVRTSIDEGVVGVVGGGLKFAFSRRWGARFDVRALFNKMSVETFVDTRSRPASGTPAGAAASFSTPSLQFSNNGTLGPSSLAGPPLNGFRTFEGSDWHNQTNLSGGVFLKF
jgi:hypothetical protein